MKDKSTNERHNQNNTENLEENLEEQAAAPSARRRLSSAIGGGGRCLQQEADHWARDPAQHDRLRVQRSGLRHQPEVERRALHEGLQVAEGCPGRNRPRRHLRSAGTGDAGGG